tara:strand:- start:4093 stop:4578 length:486 start_codon:yes stop_codon:yes gene_type:complete
MNEAPAPDGTPALLVVAIVILFPIVFCTFWVGVCFLISRFGWHQFAQDFAATNKPREGAMFFGRSGRFGLLGFGQYGNCLDATLIPAGIYLSVNVLFRCGHRPLLIPWSKVERVEERSFLFVNFLHVVVRHGTRKLFLRMPLQSRELIENYRREATASETR